MKAAAGTGGRASSAREVGEALATLFPPFAATAVIALDGLQPACPYPEERAAVAGAAAGRRAEFLAGRACAHRALGALGRDGVGVGRGPAREPLWPPGVVGSISHAGDLAVAVAATDSHAWGLGVDLEPLESPLDAAVERLVLTDSERTACRSWPGGSTTVFCIKECVYKCVFPATRWQLEFEEVTVELDPASGRYRAILDERFRLGGIALPPLEGRVGVAGGFALAGLCAAPLTG